MSFGSEVCDLLTTRQAAELVGRSPDVIKKALRRGHLRGGVHVDGFWRVPRDELMVWEAQASRRAGVKKHSYERAAMALADYGSVSPAELSELLKVHVGNARKYLAILASQGRAHRHDDGEWFPGPDCQHEEAAS